MQSIIENFKKNEQIIEEWLLKQESQIELPLYSSVDIRDSGFKSAVVDTNLFPAGFNNLGETDLDSSVEIMKKAILDRVPACRDVLIIAEEHTRNVWYLENVRILASLIERAGFNCKVATFFDVNNESEYVDLVTATDKSLRLFSVSQLVNKIREGHLKLDFVLLNNDLTTGIPDSLRELKVPIYPSIQAGWHSRSKSYHFQHVNEVVNEFGDLIGLDPWLFSCLSTSTDKVNVNDEDARQALASKAADLLDQISEKYKKHGIIEKPYLFLKADSGTYGMGVMAFENPKDIIDLNRKGKNKLYKGKSSQVISKYLLQEGVPSRCRHHKKVCEVCIYQINNSFVGGFYRIHETKNHRESLNSKGMGFSQVSSSFIENDKEHDDLSSRHNLGETTLSKDLFRVYHVLARIAGIAAHREIQQMHLV